MPTESSVTQVLELFTQEQPLTVPGTLCKHQKPSTYVLYNNSYLQIPPDMQY